MEVITKTLAKRLQSESCVLCERSLLIAGQEARYYLLERAPQYFVACVYGEEHSLCPLGHSLSRAIGIMEALIKGEVTPCTMADVIGDLEAEP